MGGRVHASERKRRAPARRRRSVLTGKVKWVHEATGFGFVETADGDVFVQFAGTDSEGFRRLREGQQVELEVSQGEKRPRALRVHLRPQSQLSDERAFALLAHAIARSTETVKAEPIE